MLMYPIQLVVKRMKQIELNRSELPITTDTTNTEAHLIDVVLPNKHNNHRRIQT